MPLHGLQAKEQAHESSWGHPDVNRGPLRYTSTMSARRAAGAASAALGTVDESSAGHQEHEQDQGTRAHAPTPTHRDHGPGQLRQQHSLTSSMGRVMSGVFRSMSLRAFSRPRKGFSQELHPVVEQMLRQARGEVAHSAWLELGVLAWRSLMDVVS